MPSDLSPTASSAASTHVRLDFDPARDGFAFRNRFEWTDADLSVLDRRLRPLASAAVGAAAAIGGAAAGPVGAAAGAVAGAAVGATGLGGALVRAVARQWGSFGLCGGMALAAIERWPQAGRVPTSALQADALRPLLRRRQEATLRAALPRFAAEWARARRWGPAEAPLAASLARELDRIEATLRGGRPALVGLVGDAPDPFANHQVVVFGMDRTGPVSASLDVYDPNGPGQTRWIRTASGARAGTTSVATSLPTGRRPDGSVHISTRAHGLTHLFEIRVG